jgi:hypothetical protein
LEQLHITGNLVGSIPSTIGQLVNMNEFHLECENENFTLTLPVEMGSWRNLVSLRVHGSQAIGGALPTTLGNLVNLRSLSLVGGGYTGTFPTEYGKLQSLESLYLKRLRLTGSLPTELGKLISLTSLLFESIGLSATLPTEIGNLSAMNSLLLLSSGLYGLLPTELGKLRNLSILTLASLNVSGYLPTELSRLQSLSVLSITSVPLSGTIPLEFEQLVSLQRVAILKTKISPSCVDRFIPEDHFYQLSCSVDIAFNCPNCTAPMGCNNRSSLCRNTRFLPTKPPSFSPTLVPIAVHCDAGCQFKFFLLVVIACILIVIFGAILCCFCCRRSKNLPGFLLDLFPFVMDDSDFSIIKVDDSGTLS